MQRSAAPLRQCEDALFLDTSELTIDQAVEAVLARAEQALSVKQ
jgi:cytidylate kinase